jgi:hypothetical protein
VLLDTTGTRPGIEDVVSEWPARLARIEAGLRSDDLKLVFLVGMARSGTTWLSQLLAQEAVVSTMRETHLFNTYLRSVRQTLGSDPPSAGVESRLSCAPETLRRALRDLVLRVLLERIPLGTWPRVVVEKTPTHCFFIPLILHLIPEAYILDIVRDPRGVVASWKALAETPAGRWARRGTIDLSREWVKTVRMTGEAAGLTERFLRVRYESLHQNGPSAIAGVFAWLGLQVDSVACQAHVAACRIERLRAGHLKGPLGGGLTAEERANHFRRGEVEGWRQDLTRGEIARIEHVAGATMATLGYALEGPSIPVWPSLALHWVAERLERGAASAALRLKL